MKLQNMSVVMSRNYGLMILLMLLSACAFLDGDRFDEDVAVNEVTSYDYRIGPGDTLDIFVWRNPEVSAVGIPVRPDGRISSPLVDSLMASDKTPSELADEIETILAEYIKEPLVTVTVKQISGGYEQQVRVVGEAANPRALPYRKDMSILDVMIAVGGLTEFADGNKASIVRQVNNEEKNIRVRLDDLLRSGKVEANTKVQPGDIIVIPEAWF